MPCGDGVLLYRLAATMASRSIAFSCARAADSTCGDEVCRAASCSQLICCCHSLDRSDCSIGGQDEGRVMPESFEKMLLKEAEVAVDDVRDAIV